MVENQGQEKMKLVKIFMLIGSVSLLMMFSMVKVENYLNNQNIEKMMNMSQSSSSIFVKVDEKRAYYLRVNINNSNELNTPNAYVDYILYYDKGIHINPQIDIVLGENYKADDALIERNKKFFENLKRYDFSSTNKDILKINKEKMEEDYKKEVLRTL